MNLDILLVWQRRHCVLVTCVLSSLLIGTAANAGPIKNPVAAADLDSLKIRSNVFSDGPVTLEHGEFRAPAAPRSASEIIIRLTDKRVFGVLNGRPAAGVIVATSTGGTGTFYELALLSKMVQGWTNTDTVLLGDRVAVHSIAIEGSSIVITMTKHGPRDPLCCPTQEVKQRFVVRGDQLVTIP